MLTCVIFAKNRKRETYSTLLSVRIQTVKPDFLVLIENIGKEKNFNLPILKKMFLSTKVKVAYHAVRYKNVSESRKLSLKFIKTDLAIFLDNDVRILSNHFEKTKTFFTEHPDVSALVGPVFPINTDYISSYVSYLSFHGNRDLRKVLPISYYGMACVALHIPDIRKYKISFDSGFNTGEDVDFFLSLGEKGGKIVFDPSLPVYHNFRQTDIFSLMIRFYSYASDFLKIEQKHPMKYHVSGRLPHRKLHWLILPFYMLDICLRHMGDETPIRYIPLALLVQLSILTGIYNSKEGRVRLKENFKRNFNL